MPYDINQFSPGYGGTINSSGNVVNIADTLDEATGQFKPPAMKQFTFQSGATAIGNGTVADVSGYATLMLQVTISTTATVVFEASLDGINYGGVSSNSTNATGTQANTTNAAGTSNWRISVVGFKYFRVRISSYTSGTVDAIGYASTAPFSPQYVTTAYGNSDSNAISSTLLGVGAYNLLFDGTNWARAKSANGVSDAAGLGITTTALYGFNGTNWDRVRSVNTGQLRTTLYNSVGTEPLISQNLNNNDGLNAGSALLGVSNFNTGFAGATWDRVRVGKVYKYIEYLNLANATATTVWTPAAGKKFRLMGVQVGTSSGSNALVHLRDGAAGSGSPFYTVRTGQTDTKDFSFGNGYISSASNNVLEIYNNTGATCSVWVTAWGTEE